MKQYIFYTVLLGLLLATTACNRFYKSPDFEKITKGHKIIAVLPYEMVMTGRLPKDLKEEDKMKIEEAESLGFQKSMVHTIHVVGARGRRKLTVKIQPAERTNAILAENNISVRESWNQDPQKLATLLGVDAVIKSKATKQRFLSDLESLGIAIGNSVLQVLTGGLIWAPTRTNEVEVMVSIIDAKGGETIFTGRDEISVDFSRPANEAIEQINRRVCRRFPYVEK